MKTAMNYRDNLILHRNHFDKRIAEIRHQTLSAVVEQAMRLAKLGVSVTVSFAKDGLTVFRHDDKGGYITYEDSILLDSVDSLIFALGQLEDLEIAIEKESDEIEDDVTIIFSKEGE